jgi:hypothetical protein
MQMCEWVLLQTRAKACGRELQNHVPVFCSDYSLKDNLQENDKPFH